MLERLPRIPLANLPTALMHLPRLSKHLGINLYIKRDDNTGLALGGNKARKLEFLLGDALMRGADTLITTGGPQSNHCRMTAAAAAQQGLACHLVFSGPQIKERQGNLYLDELLGAKLYFPGLDDAGEISLYMEDLANNLKAAGRKPYLVPLGGSNAVGAVGYINAIMELHSQTQGHSLQFDYIVHASGSAGTQAGLLAGVKACGLRSQVFGISVSRPKARLLREVLALAQATLAHAVIAERVLETEVQVFDEYIGLGYGMPTDSSRHALHAFATLEGVILDPVYTGKAASGLFDLTAQGAIPKDANVLFWHTGGTPALFADPSIHWRAK